MAELKKNQMNQILFVMVDGTDFATIESTLGAASVAARFYGVNHGGSVAMTSGALSKACSTVHSGIFRQTLKAAECNYDYVVYRFTATGCADQVLAFQTVTNDDSDIYSLMSDFLSDFQSRVPKLVATNSQLSDLASDLRSYLVGMSGMLSDAHSAAKLGASRALVNQSLISDIDSAITSRFLIYTSDISDIKSMLTYLSDLGSNAYSAAVVGASRALLNQSMLSDIDSALTSNFLIYTSDISDLKSMLTYLSDLGSNAYSAAVVGASRALVCQSMISDVDSALSSRLSRVSDYTSNIISMLTVNQSLISDAHSAAAQANSRALVIQSMASDIDSALSSQFLLTTSTLSDIDSAVSSQFARVSDYLSDLLSVAVTTGVKVSASDMSDLRSAIAAVTVSLGASDLSDIASAVIAGINSGGGVALDASTLSDIRSAVAAVTVTMSASDVSDIASAVVAAITAGTGVPLDASTMSDLRSMVAVGPTTYVSNISDILSMLLVNQSLISDTHSAAAQANSRALVLQSMISDVDSAVSSQFAALSDMISNVDSAITSQYTAGNPMTASDLSDIRSAIAAIQISASDISDIASAVLYSTRFSNSVVVRIEDIWNALSDTDSAVNSQYSDLC